MSSKDTKTIQNIISRLSDEVFLNVEKPPKNIKKQYYICCEVIRRAGFELDVLNDMIDDYENN